MADETFAVKMHGGLQPHITDVTCAIRHCVAHFGLKNEISPLIWSNIERKWSKQVI